MVEGLQQVYDIKEIPFNIELEKEVLGIIFLDDRLMEDVVDTVKRDVFYHEYHKEIWTAMMYLYHNNVGIGIETVLNRLQFKECSDELLEYVFTITQPSTYSFKNKVDLLLDIYYKRAIYTICLDIVQKDITGIVATNIVKKVEDGIERMGVTSNIEYKEFSETVDEWLEYQEDETPIKSLKTGFGVLDDTVLFEPSEFYLIGARPSVGKSTFALNLVKNFALQNYNVMFISKEMNDRQYMDKLMSNMANVEYVKFKRKLKKTPQEWQRIMTAREQVKKFNVVFEHKKVSYIEQLEGFAKYFKKRDKLDVLVVDYLQLLQTHKYKGQRQNEVSFISQKLKQIAMNLEIPVIALTQLSRKAVSQDGTPREPQLSDLRDSGSLEQDSGVVMMLHSEDIEQKYEERRFIKMFVRKNRYGVLKTINYTYFGDYSRFIEKDKVDGVWTETNYDVLGDI